jgi:hypothetical protein
MTSTFGFSEGFEPEDIPPVPGSIPEAQTLSEKEKALRDLFVSEYLVDYDEFRAAQRCGFNAQFAREYGRRFMEEPYVASKISQLRIAPTVNEKDLLDYNQRRVREGLVTEAHYRGPGSSHAARVSALKALAEITGMVKKVETKSQANLGGVMAVPGIADIDQWEKVASASQDALVQDAGTGE